MEALQKGRIRPQDHYRMAVPPVVMPTVQIIAILLNGWPHVRGERCNASNPVIGVLGPCDMTRQSGASLRPSALEAPRSHAAHTMPASKASSSGIR